MSKETRSMNYCFLMSMDDETRRAHKKARKDERKRRSEKDKKERKINYMNMYLTNKF